MNKIKIIYLYIFSLVGLVLIVIGGVKIVNTALKAYVFTKADEVLIYPRIVPPKVNGEETQILSPEKEAEYQKRERSSRSQRDIAEGLAFLIVGTPLYLYHWNLVRKEK